MNETPDLIDILRDWWNRVSESGLELNFSESENRFKRSVAVTASGKMRLARLVLWDSGEADLTFADIQSGDISYGHRDLRSGRELIDVAEAIIDWAHKPTAE